jgi:protease IV
MKYRKSLFIITLLALGSFNLYSAEKLRYPAKKKIFNKFTTIKDPKQGTQIGVVEIRGTIKSSTDICLELQELRDDIDIKAILLIIDSPGGITGHAATIYEEICHCKKIKPTVGYIESMGCSAAYWIACGCDTIIASRGAVIGSIGVLLGDFRVTPTEYFDGQFKGHVEYDPIVAGKFKDTTNPHKELTGEERDYLQEGVDKMYDLFCSVVAQSRNLDLAQKELWADGKAFNSPEALELGMIDSMGSLTDSIAIIGSRLSRWDNVTKLILIKLTSTEKSNKKKKKSE